MMLACGSFNRLNETELLTGNHKPNSRSVGTKTINFVTTDLVIDDPDCAEADMKTQGEIEAAICQGINRFEQEYMGRGPKAIHAHLIGDLLVVRLQGVLTAAEQHLVKSLPAEKGRNLLKQVRTHLVETARPVMEAMVEEATGIKVLSLHHDISTVTGEELITFTLANAPDFRSSGG